jgi:hypothetical protein
VTRLSDAGAPACAGVWIVSVAAGGVSVAVIDGASGCTLVAGFSSSLHALMDTHSDANSSIAMAESKRLPRDARQCVDQAFMEASNGTKILWGVFDDVEG